MLATGGVICDYVDDNEIVVYFTAFYCFMKVSKLNNNIRLLKLSLCLLTFTCIWEFPYFRQHLKAMFQLKAPKGFRVVLQSSRSALCTSPARTLTERLTVARCGLSTPPPLKSVISAGHIYTAQTHFIPHFLKLTRGIHKPWQTL